MSLPNTYSNIQPQSFYPDRVTLNLQYKIDFPHSEVTKGLRSNGFKPTSFGWSYRLNMHGVAGYRLARVPLRVSRTRNSATYNCYLDLNLLKVLNDSRDDYRELSSIRDSTNWLHPAMVQADMRQLWGLHDVFIQRAQSVIWDIFSDIQIQSGHRRATLPECSHISVNTLECAIDLYSMNPRQLVHQFTPAFGALLKDVELREYPNAARRVIRPEADWFVHGFLATGERIKSYVKTNQRVRFEYRFQPNGFARLGISRGLSVEQPDFSTLFAQCAYQSHMTFTAMRAVTRSVLNINSQHTLIDLICLLISCTRKQNVLRELLDCLIRTGKVQNGLFDRQLVKLLCSRGLLERSLAHGFSRVTPQYARALRGLRKAHYKHFTPALLQGLANSSRALCTSRVR